MGNREVLISVIIGVLLMLFLATVFIMSIVRYNKRLFAHGQEKRNLQMHFKEQLLQSQLEIQEHTFNTISKEIHDNVGQILSLAKVQVNIIEQGEKLDRPLLADLKESIGKAMTDLRDIAKSLNSDRIKLSSLIEMTNHELQRIGRLGIIKTFLFTEGIESHIEEQRRLIILRIVQETLQNILKHAKADKIEVFFHYGPEHLKLIIADNGIGFDSEQKDIRDGLGLQNMISRAALIGAECSIKSNINEGTTITITLPYA